MAISPSKTADMALTICRQRRELTDLQRQRDVSVRYWVAMYGDSDRTSSSDPDVDAFLREFRGEAQRDGLTAIQPIDVEPESNR